MGQKRMTPREVFRLRTKVVRIGVPTPYEHFKKGSRTKLSLMCR